MTLELKVIHIFSMTLLISGCVHATCYWLDLGVDSNILNVEELKKSKFGYLTLMVNLDFQGQTNSFKIYIIFKVNHHS